MGGSYRRGAWRPSASVLASDWPPARLHTADWRRLAPCFPVCWRQDRTATRTRTGRGGSSCRELKSRRRHGLRFDWLISKCNQEVLTNPDSPEHSEGSITVTLARMPADKPMPNAAGTATPSVTYTQNHRGFVCTNRVVMPYRDANTSPDTNPSRLQPPSRR